MRASGFWWNFCSSQKPLMLLDRSSWISCAPWFATRHYKGLMKKYNAGDEQQSDTTPTSAEGLSLFSKGSMKAA
jgi:hypothetical protein